MGESLLYVVATPIGNLGDLTHRAESVLRSVDFIISEDTRVTAKLLNHLGIKKEQVSYYRHNMDSRGADILDRIAAGEDGALCCDAGTPAVSDPGELLVKQAAGRGIRMIPIPGSCAAITALCVSGLITGRFCFEGFLPVSKKNRSERLSALLAEERTMIFYEAPHKLRNTLRDLGKVFGNREITLARELTKIHEEIERTTLHAANAEYEEREPKGEYVLVVSGAPAPEPVIQDDAVLVQLVLQKIDEGLSISNACREIARQKNISRSALYQKVLLARTD